MTLDLALICICSVPIAGIAVRQRLMRDFLLGDRKLVTLPCLDDEVAPVALADNARDGAAEMTVSETVKDDLRDLVERFA
jgi:hypothetical protein